jgi:glutamate-ammonia-ligase adenylyltransferase
MLKRDIVEMRERIAREYPPSNPWKVKHASGGLMEITFLAQYLALRYGEKHPALLQADTAAILTEAARLGLLPAAETERLLESWFFQSRLASLLRLCQRDFSEDTAPKGLLQFLANTLKVADASALRETLLFHQRHAHAMFGQFISAMLTF